MKKIKEYLKENYKFIIVLILFSILCIYPLPYYIDAPGGVTNLDSKIKIGDSKINGSYNMTYVNEYRATIPTILYALVRNFDIYKKRDVMLVEETDKEYNLRDKLYLEESLSNAVAVAYTKANKKINIKNNYLYVGYVLENSNNDLEVGDRVISIDDIKVNTKKEINDLLSKKNVGSNVKIKVTNNNKEYERNAKIINEDGKNIIGFVPIEVYNYETSPKVTIRMDKNESGSSGGLMLSLAIYDILENSDLAKGRKIAGTGTIDLDGNVGEIGGIKYKVQAAAKNKVDVFFVPSDNYKEATKTVKKSKLKLNLVKVNSIDDAINYLQNN